MSEEKDNVTHLVKIGTEIFVRPVLTNENRFLLVAAKNTIFGFDTQSWKPFLTKTLGNTIKSLCCVKEAQNLVICAHGRKSVSIFDVNQREIIASKNFPFGVISIICTYGNSFLMIIREKAKRINKKSKKEYFNGIENNLNPQKEENNKERTNNYSQNLNKNGWNRRKNLKNIENNQNILNTINKDVNDEIDNKITKNIEIDDKIIIKNTQNCLEVDSKNIDHNSEFKSNKYLFSIAVGDLTDLNKDIKIIAKLKEDSHEKFLFVEENRCFIVLRSNLIVQYFLDENFKIFSKNKIQLDLTAVCIAANPAHAAYAIGFNDGSIQIYNIEEKNHYSRLHWHYNPVSDLAFGPDESSLISGGLESVLVRWNLNNNSNEFLPRLGDGIKFILNCDDFIVILHYNNEISIVDQFNFKLCKKILHFQFNDTFLNFDEKSESLVTTGRAGTLVFFSPALSQPVYTLDVCQQNFVGGSRVALLESQLVITHAHFSKNYNWLYTVEQNFNNIHLMRIRFFSMEVGSQNFTFKTSLENFHRNKINDFACFKFSLKSLQSLQPLKSTNQENTDDISDISTKFCKNLDFIATASEDKTVKIFAPFSTKINEEIIYRWELYDQFSYLKNPPKKVLASDLLKIFVVSSRKSLNFYDLSNSFLKIDELLLDNIQDVFLVENGLKSLVIIGDQKNVMIYDYKRCQIIFSRLLIYDIMIVDHDFLNFCLFSHTKKGDPFLTIYEIDTFNRIQKISLKNSDRISSCVFGMKFSTRPERLKISAQLYFYTSCGDIYVISEENVRLDRLSDNNIPALEERKCEAFKKKLEKDDGLLLDYRLRNREKEFIQKLSTVPTHLLPPTNVLLNHYLNAICSREKTETKIDESTIEIKFNSKEYIKPEILDSKTKNEKFSDNFQSSIGLKFNKIKRRFEC